MNESIVNGLMAVCDKALDERRAEKRERRELSPAEYAELFPLARAVTYGASHD